MPNEVLIYTPIFSFTAEAFIQQLNEFEGEDVTVRLNSPGGSVFAGWGMVAKSQEYTGKITIKVDGTADSMAAVYLLFNDNVEALNVSRFMLHRASTGSSDPEMMRVLSEINSEIRAAFESKLNISKFEEIAGVTLDEFFNSENPIDVNLNAQQAKDIGLVKKVNTLNPAEATALNTKFAAMSGVFSNKDEKFNSKSEPKKNKKMTIEELKNQHPDVYNKVFALGEEAGVKAEKDRCDAWMVYNEVDPKAVAEGIESGDPLSAKASAELNKKSYAAEFVANSQRDSQDDVDTYKDDNHGKDADAKADDKEMSAFSTDVDKILGINQKKTK